MKELWLQNLGTSDVSLSDLGVKVPAGKTIELFKTNPYLTKDKVKKSMSVGSLKKRLESKVLKVVNKQVNIKPEIVKNLKASKSGIKVKKTKTGVVIETNIDDVESSEGFDFADYGIDEVVSQTKDKGAVVTVVKQDEEIEPDKGLELEPQKQSGLSKQNSQVIIDKAPKVKRVDAVDETAEEDFEPEFNEDTESAIKVATKTEDGAIMMELVENEKEEE